MSGVKVIYIAVLVYHDHLEHHLLIQFLPFARGFGDRIEYIIEILELVGILAVRIQPALSHVRDVGIVTFFQQGFSRHQDLFVGGMARSAVGG